MSHDEFSSDDRSLDEDFFRFHVESVHFCGSLPGAHRHGTLLNPRCGDQVTLEAMITGDARIEQLRFQSTGCVVSRAAASILCEYATGKPLLLVRGLAARQMLGLIRIPLSPGRYSCGLLAFHCLQQMIRVDE